MSGSLLASEAKLLSEAMELIAKGLGMLSVKGFSAEINDGAGRPVGRLGFDESGNVAFFPEAKG